MHYFKLVKDYAKVAIQHSKAEEQRYHMRRCDYICFKHVVTDQCVNHICKIIPRSYLACTVWCITMVKLGDNMGLRAQQSRAGVRSSAVQVVEKRWANVLSQCCKIWMIPSPVTSPTNIYVRMRWDLTGRPQSRRPSDLVFLLEEFESIWYDIGHGYQFSKILWEFQQKSGTKSFNMSSIVSRLSSNHWLSFSCHRHYILERLWLKHTFWITKIQQNRSQVTLFSLQKSLNKITDSGTPRVFLMIFGDFEWFWSSERLELGSACSGRFRRDLGAISHWRDFFSFRVWQVLEGTAVYSKYI